MKSWCDFLALRAKSQSLFDVRDEIKIIGGSGNQNKVQAF
jgi:hypothetical protein